MLSKDSVDDVGNGSVLYFSVVLHLFQGFLIYIERFLDSSLFATGIFFTITHCEGRYILFIWANIRNLPHLLAIDAGIKLHIICRTNVGNLRLMSYIIRKFLFIFF